MSVPDGVTRRLPPRRADLALVEGYHSPQVAVRVKLNTNESPLPPPQAWLDELQREVGALSFNRYPDRSARALREAIAAHHGVEPENVFAANGSNEVLQAICLAYGGAGRAAATFEPTYAMHGHIARTTGTDVVVGERGADLRLDPHEVERVMAEDRPAITFLCSPNNPTGESVPPELTARALERSTGLVVVDEAYGQFARRSALDVLRSDPGAPLAVTRTFSKTWSMAAARLGYCVGPAELVADLESVTLPYHLDAVKQAAGRLALRHVAEMEERVAAIVAERERVVAALASLDVDVFDSDASFVLLRIRSMPARDVWQALVDRSVLVRDCSTWPRLDGCLRVTIGTPDEDDAFLAAITEVLG